MRFAVTAFCVALLAGSVAAGVLDDLKAGASSVRDTIGDVKSTKDESKGVVTDAEGLAKETQKEVQSAVPESAKPASSDAAAPAAAPSQASRAAGAPPPPPSAVTAPPPPPSATQWHIDLGNGQTKQVSQGELASLISAGQVRADTPVYTPAQGSWQPAGQVPALQPLFPKK